MSKAERLNQHDLTLNDYSFRIAAVDSRVDALKDDRDSLERRVFALEKAVQNQDDTIENEDASFKVGDRVVASGDADEYGGPGVVTSIDTDDMAYPYLVNLDVGGEVCWFSADELRHVSPSTPFPATGNTPVAETFKVGDRIVVAHAAYKKYAGRMGCVSSVGHTAQGVVQYSVDFDGEDCTVYFFPADELRHADSDVKQDAVDVNSAPTFKVGDNVAATSANIPGTVALVVHNGAWIDHHYGGLRKFYPYDQLRHADALDVDVTAYAGVIHTNSHGDQFHVIPRGDFLESEHWRHAFNVEERESLDMRQALAKAEARVKQVESDMTDERLYGAGMRDAAARLLARAEDAEARADRNSLIARGLARRVAEFRKWDADRDAHSMKLADDASDREMELMNRLADAQQERNELRSQVIELRVQLQRARSEQRIDPARAGLSQMGPFTYYPSSAEPEDVTRVVDSYGDAWVREEDGSWSGDVGAIHEGYRDSWDDVLDQYGPLTEERNA